MAPPSRPHLAQSGGPQESTQGWNTLQTRNKGQTGSKGFLPVVGKVLEGRGKPFDFLQRPLEGSQGPCAGNIERLLHVYGSSCTPLAPFREILPLRLASLRLNLSALPCFGFRVALPVSAQGKLYELEVALVAEVPFSGERKERYDHYVPATLTHD